MGLESDIPPFSQEIRDELEIFCRRQSEYTKGSTSGMILKRATFSFLERTDNIITMET